MKLSTKILYCTYTVALLGVLSFFLVIYLQYIGEFKSTASNQYPYDQFTLFKYSFDPKNIKVAIIDDGVNSSLSSLSGINLKSYNLYENHKITDEHGTAIADIIYNSNLLNYRNNMLRKKLTFVSIDISKMDGEIDVNSLIEGINKAIEEKVNIINISLGTYKNDERLKNVVNRAIKEGIIVVASSGNDSTDQDIFPASYENVVSVTSTDSNHNYLLNNNKGESITVSIPGENIPTNVENNENEFGVMTGTSASAAVFTSAVIVFKEIDPGLTANSLIKALKVTSIDLGDKGKDSVYRYGFLDFKKCAMFVKNKNLLKFYDILH